MTLLCNVCHERPVYMGSRCAVCQSAIRVRELEGRETYCSCGHPESRHTDYERRACELRGRYCQCSRWAPTN